VVIERREAIPLGLVVDVEVVLLEYEPALIQLDERRVEGEPKHTLFKLLLRSVLCLVENLGRVQTQRV
jgi:hypothetical protein